MIYQLAAVLSTYTTRRWLMAGVLLGSLFVLGNLIVTGNFSQSQYNPVGVLNGVALPILLVTSLLVHQAKWQFVHWRARLVPGYVKAHLLVLFTLLVLVLVAYPLVVSRVLNLPHLGLATLAAVLGATVAWGVQTMRPIFVLGYFALYLSFLVPSLSPFWFSHTHEYDLLRWTLLSSGTIAIGLWLRRLTQMTEEAEDYVIPVQGNLGGSRTEKSEARRVMALAMSRAKLQSWLADRWHDRLASLTAPPVEARPRLLRYGLSAVGMPIRVAAVLIFASLAIGFQWLYVHGAVQLADWQFDSNSSSRYGTVGMIAMFTLIMPMFFSQLLAGRVPRLGQELLLPMTRRALVGGLMTILCRELLVYALLGMVAMATACALLAPEHLTPTNAMAAILAIGSIQPLQFATATAYALIRSAIGRTIAFILTLYLVMALTAGIFALGYFISLLAALLLALVTLGLGLGAMKLAWGLWMNAELGR